LGKTSAIVHKIAEDSGGHVAGLDLEFLEAMGAHGPGSKEEQSHRSGNPDDA
jgi:hypothetical protein